jgi:DNA-directed RNA polymerase alpha subunit
MNNLRMRGVSVQMANAIRRTIISRVPSYAINMVCIKQNDSVYGDDIIVHRLGLVPLMHVAGDAHDFTLNATGPRKVYSGDIVFNKSFDVVYKNILLFELGACETVEVCGEVEKGTGEENAKWSVSCGTTYKKVDDDVVLFHIETTVGSPRDVFNTAIDILINDLAQFKKNLTLRNVTNTH